MPVGSGRSVRLRHAVGAGADMMARRPVTSNLGSVQAARLRAWRSKVPCPRGSAHIGAREKDAAAVTAAPTFTPEPDLHDLRTPSSGSTCRTSRVMATSWSSVRQCVRPSLPISARMACRTPSRGLASRRFPHPPTTANPWVAWRARCFEIHVSLLYVVLLAVSSE